MPERLKACMTMVWVATVLCAPVAQAQRSPSGPSAPPTIEAVRLPTGDAVRIDGVLDEPIWQGVQPIRDFCQREPHEGAPATEETEVRVLYDASTLYLGVLARDREPGKVIARTLQRDRVMEVDFLGQLVFGGEDGVAIILDPFHDHRNGVVFATNPNGAEFDALVTDEGREVNVNWRGIWSVAARRTGEGWSAEFAIPFRTLRYASGDGRPWGFNVYRMIRRKNEEALWTAWSRANEGLARLSRAGHLAGLGGLPRSGLNLEVKPYVLGDGTASVDSVTLTRTAGTGVNAGADAKYEVRPGLVFDASYQTDFAQVEADSEQVNLTRFNLFYPEKRDFFLENAGVFEFGTRGVGEPPPFLLFFSRRIGISDSGEVPVLGGARLTGRAGRQTVGLLDVVTEAAFNEPRANFAVARVKRDVGASNYVGVMLTDRRTADGYNTAGGVDWSYWPAGPLNVQGFVARTDTTGVAAGWAYRLGLNYETGPFGVTAQHLLVGPEVRAAAGFITRTDIRRTGGWTRVSVRPRALGLRRVNVLGFGEHIVRVNGEPQDWSAGVAFWPEWESGESFAVFYGRGSTRLDESFSLADSLLVPVGAYPLWQVAANGNTSRARAVYVEAAGQWQGIYDGCVSSVGASVTAAAGSHVRVRAGFTRNRAALPAGAFIADLTNVRLEAAFSTRLFANALVQYSGLDRRVSVNARLNYIYRPGSDLFIVLNEDRGWRASPWHFHSRGVVVKVTYLAWL